MLKAAEERLLEKEAIIKTKDDMIRSESKRWYELDKAINDLQFRFEDQSKENRQLKTKVEELETSLAMAQKQRESRETAIVSLKEEVTKWRTELTSARDLLATSAVPEVAELERLRKERDAAEEKARKATKRADDSENTIGFVRKQYDEVTERVIELNQVNEEFRTRLQKAEKLAHGEVSKARKMNLESQTEIIRKENENLRRQCNELEYILKRKEEELKNKRTIVTRGGSVPRSPRIGPSSRATSPITDQRIRALKSNNL
jgi:chromosome segregation ATPase